MHTLCEVHRTNRMNSNLTNTKSYDNQMMVFFFFKQKSGGKRVTLVHFNSNNKICSRQSHKLFGAFDSKLLTPCCIHNYVYVWGHMKFEYISRINVQMKREWVSVCMIQPACSVCLCYRWRKSPVECSMQCHTVWSMRVNAKGIEYDSHRPKKNCTSIWLTHKLNEFYFIYSIYTLNRSIAILTDTKTDRYCIWFIRFLLLLLSVFFHHMNL